MGCVPIASRGPQINMVAHIGELEEELPDVGPRIAVLGGGWHVRVFSVGELISLLFAFHERVAWVSFSPLPGHQLIEDALSHLTSRDSFIESLVVR